MQETVIYRKKTPYQEILLTRLDPEERIALYLDEAIQFVSGPDDRIYHHALAGLGADYKAPRPVDVLILGGGDGLAARDLFARPHVRSVTMVELDPGMIDFAARHPEMAALNRLSLYDPRMDLRIGDARRFLFTPPTKRYDLAVLDFPDPLSHGLEDLFSRRLYTGLMGHLKPDALVAVQSSGAYSPTEDKVRRLLGHLMGDVHAVHFRGHHMADGVIVYGSKSLDPRKLRIPASWNTSNLDSNVGAELF